MAEKFYYDEREFYVVAREQGAENPSIPTWANRSGNPLGLSDHFNGKVQRIDIEQVPGAFQLLNVVGPEECQRIIELTEQLGYIEDAAVSLPRSVRHNHSLTWIVDDESVDLIWNRCGSFMVGDDKYLFGKKPLGLNSRFRFYRYQQGDYFKPHTDGSWPGSKVVGGQLQRNAFEDRWSQLTFLLFLNDDYQGGTTRFQVNPGNLPQHQAVGERNVIDVRTPLGGVLCFPHGNHPLHCVHESTEILAGSKYIIRSDVLFEI